MDTKHRSRILSHCIGPFIPGNIGMSAMGSRLYTTGPGSQPSTVASNVGKGAFAPYRQALKALAERTRTPLPSLIFSFAVLHELTAVVPVVGIFFAARTLNVGERVLKSFPDKFTNEAKYHPPEDAMSYVQKIEAQWWYEGRQMAERVGKRYGLFGFPKNGTQRATDMVEAERESILVKAGPDIVNFIIAYLTTKVRPKVHNTNHASDALTECATVVFTPCTGRSVPLLVSWIFPTGSRAHPGRDSALLSQEIIAMKP